MVGLVIATHGNLGAELLSSTEMIIGPVRNAAAVAISRDNSMEDIRDLIAASMADVGSDGDGILIATDMFGGTPANVSMTFLEEGKVEIMTGVNLPMLLKFFNSQENLGLKELAGILQAYGRKSIAMGSDYLQR
jgi:PTS system mannose-specific IIA component